MFLAWQFAANKLMTIERTTKYDTDHNFVDY